PGCSPAGADFDGFAAAPQQLDFPDFFAQHAFAPPSQHNFAAVAGRFSPEDRAGADCLGVAHAQARAGATAAIAVETASSRQTTGRIRLAISIVQSYTHPAPRVNPSRRPVVVPF